MALEAGTAQLASTEARLQLAKAKLAQSTIVAPFTGVVGLRSVGVGDYVSVGKQLITLTNIDPIKVDFRVPEMFLSRLKVGQAIQVRVDAVPDRSFTGQIFAIDPVVDINGRAIRLRAAIPNADLALKPGLFARITITVDQRENAIVIPEMAVVPDGLGKIVYIVENGKAKRVAGRTRQAPPRQGRDRQGPDPADADRHRRPDAPARRGGGSHQGQARPDEQALMTLFELFVRRPVLSTVLSLLVVLIGVVSYTRLTVREYPNIDEPIVSVQTTYRGASAEIIETQVTQILENSIAGIEGIEIISSTSRQERSNISVRFRPDVDPDVAASDVRDRVSRVRGRMPDEIDEPIIAKVEADAQPVLYLSLTSTRHSPLELTDFADRFIADRVQNVTGVAEVRILGAAPLRDADLARSCPHGRLRHHGPGHRGGARAPRTSKFRRAGSRATTANSPSSRRPA